MPTDDRTVVGSRIVFKIKKDAEGKPTRYKSRLVAQGFTQQPGLDYNDTYAPVLDVTSLRLLILIAAANGWDIQQMDVKTAYLYGDLEEEIYMRLPDGIHDFIKLPKNTQPIVRLRKSIYGLKQAGRQWYV